jgi:hypothetical protein
VQQTTQITASYMQNGLCGSECMLDCFDNVQLFGVCVVWQPPMNLVVHTAHGLHISAPATCTQWYAGGLYNIVLGGMGCVWCCCPCSPCQGQAASTRKDWESTCKKQGAILSVAFRHPVSSCVLLQSLVCVFRHGTLTFAQYLPFGLAAAPLCTPASYQLPA